MGFRKKVTSSTLLAEYRKLKATPSGEAHAKQFLKVERLAQENQQELYELVFSKIAWRDMELDNLIWLGSHKGSMAREYNEHWADFIARVRARKNELPDDIQSSLDWQERVHGW